MNVFVGDRQIEFPDNSKEKDVEAIVSVLVQLQHAVNALSMELKETKGLMLKTADRVEARVPDLTPLKDGQSKLLEGVNSLRSDLNTNMAGLLRAASAEVELVMDPQTGEPVRSRKIFKGT